MDTALINLPNLGSVVASTSPNVNSAFGVFIPIVLFGLGIAVGVALVLWLLRRVSRGIKRISHH